MMVAALAGCEEVRVAGEPPPSRVALAASALRLTLEVEQLRPAALALGDRSYGVATLDDLQERIALVRDLLSDDVSADPRRAQVAAVALLSAGIKYDAVRTDLEAAARGFSRATRAGCNRAVELTNLVSNRIAADWTWPLEHAKEADGLLSRAASLRTNAMAAAEATSVAKPAVEIASMAAAASTVEELAGRGPALSRVARWLKGEGGVGRLAPAGEGAGAGLQMVGAAGALVLTQAEIAALAQAGKLSGLALSLLYLSRGHLHHICTNKNWASDASGGPWSPAFKEILDDAGVGFDDPANLVEVEGHVGPHPQRYHELVYAQLRGAIRGLSPGTAQYRQAVLRALNELAMEIARPGTRLNLLVTGAAR
ncbi:MAG TPA: AHH domain-containing protein [Myxococcaceae bacterium]|nr:AHH domain-containing protein [Myxococcaceae bacterium]